MICARGAIRRQQFDGAWLMARLLVRNVPDDLVAALRERALRNRRSVEAEHRQILEDVLRPAYSRRRMLEALQGLAWTDPEFRPERS
jgi:plasmid stability protein